MYTIVEVIYNERVGLCWEDAIQFNLSHEEAVKWLLETKTAAYAYIQSHVNTEAYFLTEMKNKACIREYAKVKD